MSKLTISPRYKPLFDVFRGKMPHIHTVIVNGGRFSSKSFSVTIAANVGMAENNHRILFARQTMASARDSIVKEFNEKLEILGYAPYYDVNKDIITSKFNDSSVIFRGLQSSSGSNTASLKSLSNLSCLLIEEAEELKSKEELDKVRLSIRSSDIPPITVLVFNAPHASHFLYEEYFESRGVKGNFNGEKDGILYIYTNYMDTPRSVIPDSIWNEYEEARLSYELVEVNPKGNHSIKDLKRHRYYKYTVLGGWKSEVDNIIFEEWETFKEWRTDKPRYHTLGLDFGFKDPNALVEIKVYTDAIYIKQHLYKPDVSNQDLSKKIKEVEKECNGGKQMYVIADSARPEIIKELQKLGCAVIPCVKGPGSIESGIQKLNSMDIFIHEDSSDLIIEAGRYCYVIKINNLGERKIVPIDKWNHSWDATRYGISLW